MDDEQLAQAMEFLADMTAAEVARRYARQKGISVTEGLRRFMATRTYALLMDPESYLALESTEYTQDMLDVEEKGDTERWMAI
ncbi:MAG: hypothetical protein LBG62_01895 [Candidatus Methanoplasma sp.]|jgi:hypothetical protein|nr:hypothetical protein [Candidatus Methanoplasma sp.]